MQSPLLSLSVDRCLFVSLGLLFICLSILPSVCLPTTPSACISILPSVCLSILPSVCLSILPSVRLWGRSVFLPLCLHVCPSVVLFVCRSAYPFSPSVLVSLFACLSACLSYLSALTVCLLVYPCLSICLSASLLSVCLPVSSRARSLASASLGEWMLRSLEAVRFLGQLLGVRWERVVWAPSQLGTVAQHCQRHTRPLIRTPSPRSDS